MQELFLREIQLIELDILIFFKKFCETHGLRYSLAGGSLLGAIRHKGFIPWDDDIDIMMPRPDYEIFVKKFALEKNPPYVLSCQNDAKIKYPFLKLMDPKVQIEENHVNEVHNCWVDIFPIDGFPNSQKQEVKLIKKADYYRAIIFYLKLQTLSAYTGERGGAAVWLRRIYARLYTYRRANKNLMKLAEKYDYNSSDYVGCVVWGLYGIGERMLKSEFEKFVDVEFEGHTFKAMSCWDSYLTGLYGNYMQLPPEEKRITHGFKAYRIEEEHE